MKARENEGRDGIAQEKTDAPVSAHGFIIMRWRFENDKGEF